MVMYVWPLLGILSLGILYPMAMLKGNEYMVKNSSYGTTSFDFHATFKDYGVIFLTLLGAGLTHNRFLNTTIHRIGCVSYVPLEGFERR